MKTKKFICEVCNKCFDKKVGLSNHIFSRNIKDKYHNELRNILKESKLIGKNKICPVCRKRFSRFIGKHVRCLNDTVHKSFYEKQKTLIVDLFKQGNSFNDMTRIDNPLIHNFSPKYFAKICKETLGSDKVSIISRMIFALKRKEFWKNINPERRNSIMARVRYAQWGNMDSEQRKKHPWVVAGRIASLKSSKRGSKNQRYAFKLLKNNLPQFNWIYNYTFNDEWHFDVVDPDNLIFIEWDGRHHFIPIHGQSYLNNRINRDKIKNKIVTEQIKGCLIRIKDEGRANKRFVEKKINEIDTILKKNVPRGRLIQL